MSDIGKTNAFTLAEVLITLGIIGIVSALTMPTLIQNGQEKALETATQKFYNTLQTAIDNYMQEKELTNMSQMDNTMVDDFVTNSFKKAQKLSNCEDAFVAGGQYYGTLAGGTRPAFRAMTDAAGDFSNGASCYKLNDGTIIGFKYADNKLNVIADINGSKGPKQIGRDFWMLDIRNKGEVYEVGEPDGSASLENSTASCGSYACGSYACGGGYYGDSSSSSTKSVDEIINENYEKCKAGTTYYGCFTHLRLNDFKFDY